MIKAVLFDLDGTLLDRNSSIIKFVSSQYDRFFSTLNISKPDFVSRFVELDCKGQVFKDQVYQTLVTEFALGHIRWEHLLEDYKTKFMSFCVPFPGLKETLNVLKMRKHSLGIITNGFGDFQTRVIQSLGIESYFGTIVISEMEGIAKPDKAIFCAALERMRATPMESVFVGDHPEVDIAGAKGAGMTSIWKRNTDWPGTAFADAEIDELLEVPDVIIRFNSWSR